MRHIPSRSGRPRERFAIAPRSRRRLAELVDTTRDAAVARRAKAILLRAQGAQVGQIGNDLGVSRATVHRWVEEYRRHRMRSVEEARKAGRPRDYPRRRIRALFDLAQKYHPRHVGFGNVWTARKLAEFAKRRWREGAEGMTHRKMRRLLNDAGFVFTKDGWGLPTDAKLRRAARRQDAARRPDRTERR